MSSRSPGYTSRVAATAGFNANPEHVQPVASPGAETAALDVVESTHKNVLMAITCNTSSDEHSSGYSLPSMCLAAAVAEGVITVATLAASLTQLT